VEEPTAAGNLTPLWLRQACDTDESWDAFKAYRDMAPPRNMARIYVNRVQVPIAKVSSWLRDHNWRDRCRAYDNHMEEILITQREDFLRQKTVEITADWMCALKDAREIIAKELMRLRQTSEESDGPGLLKPNELVRLMDMVIKYDRLLRGESTEQIDTKVDLSQLSVEDLRELKRMHEKISSGGSRSGD
jgi:hypothetical protein